jgi:NhaP-type Na+/H+ or K+/H+ antiporter
MKGLHIKTGTVNWYIPKVCDAVAVPPLVGMIIAGCLARNYLCKAYMDHYPEDLSSNIRLICLSIILLRGGLELSFAGKGLTMVLLTLFPQIFEAVGSGVATKYIFPDFTWPLCFAHGFTLGAVSPAVVVPSMMLLHKAGYGVKAGIPTSMIAASSFDDIIAITAFGVFITIAKNQAPGGVASVENGGDSIGFEVFMNLV